MTTASPIVLLAATLALLTGPAPARTPASPAPPVPAVPAEATHEEDEEHEEGYAAAKARQQEPDAIEAAMTRESYAPGATAAIRFWDSLDGVRLGVYRVGSETIEVSGDSELHGVSVAPVRLLGKVRAGSTAAVPIGRWPSGLYFVRLTATGRTGYATFVVRPARYGENPVAIVMPTRTWQSYNFRDGDGDGRGDTWYAHGGQQQLRLVRPYLNRGVPPHFRRYDLRFLRWLAQTGKTVDVLAQADLDTAQARDLAAYRAIVFPGHHEYVTKAEYDVVERYRDLGGNLAFLSANNFFWRVDVRAGVMTRVAQWRQLGRPESRLIGVQYNGNDRGERRGPWLVRETSAAEWLFAGVALRNGEEFSSGGTEIDSVTTASPPQLEVVGEIPELLGPGRTAQMTYYETRAGARVFAAGAFTLAGSVYQPGVRRLLENLWTRLVEEEL